MEITPAQKKELDTWAIKRDAILRSIATLSTQEEEKTRTNLALSASNTDLETRINQATGRLKELDDREAARAGLVSKEVSDLEIRKSALQAEIPPLEKEIGALKSEKNILIELISALKTVYDKIVESMGGLEKIVEHVTRISGQNISDFKVFFEELKKSVNEIISINKDNAVEAQKIVSRLPKTIIDMQRPREIIRPILNKKRQALNEEIK